MCVYVCVLIKQRPAVATSTAFPSEDTLPSLLEPGFVHFGQIFKLALLSSHRPPESSIVECRHVPDGLLPQCSRLTLKRTQEVPGRVRREGVSSVDNAPAE